MPKNYYQDRPVYSHHPSCLMPGDKVQIIQKHLQGSRSLEDLTYGVILRVLSKGRYYENGVKVEILNWENDWTEDERELIIQKLKDAPVDSETANEWQKCLKTTIGRVQYVYFHE